MSAYMARALLIVEDVADVGRSYLRCFKRYIERVQLAQTPEEAVNILSQKDPPELILCDHWLGKDNPTGAELIKAWRKQFPFLSKAALVTGSDLAAVQNSPGVDAIFHKPPNLDAIVNFFQLQMH
jgi:DNA-binding NtrC family response regulator